MSLEVDNRGHLRNLSPEKEQLGAHEISAINNTTIPDSINTSQLDLINKLQSKSRPIKNDNFD
jgi:hypothetical protein